MRLILVVFGGKCCVDKCQCLLDSVRRSVDLSGIVLTSESNVEVVRQVIGWFGSKTEIVGEPW